MRFSRKCQIVLSEDDVTQPLRLRFAEDLETLDNGTAAILKDGGGTTITVPANTTDFELPMPQIVTGKWLYLYSGDKPFTLKLHGSAGPTMTMREKKASEFWHDYTQAPLITTGADAVRLTYAIAGD